MFFSFNPTSGGLLRFMHAAGGHKVPRSICGPLMSTYMVQVPIHQHESMNTCISSHLKGKIAFVGHFSALGNDCSQKGKIQILANFDFFCIFQKIRFLAVTF